MKTEIITKDKFGKCVWPDLQIEYFKAMYPSTFNCDLIKMFGVSERTILRKARRLNLWKEPEFMDNRRDIIKVMIRDGMFESTKQSYNRNSKHSRRYNEICAKK